MKGAVSVLISLLLVFALVVVLVPPAAANPWPAPPTGYRMGKSFQITALDTLWFTRTRPTGSAAATYFGPQTVPVFAAAGAVPRYETRLVEGVMLGATKPFRMRLYWAGGMASGTTQVPVDTLSTARGTGAFSVAYPCCFVGVGQLDSLRLTPGASDTVWGVTLYKDTR